MISDRITANVAMFAPRAENVLGDPEVIHPVGLSGLRAYFETMDGPDIPTEPVARNLRDRLFEAMAELSTSHELSADIAPLKYVPYFLKYCTPIVEGTFAIGKYLEPRTEEVVAAQYPVPTQPDRSFLQMSGIFILSGQLIAQQLSLPDPLHLTMRHKRMAAELSPSNTVETDAERQKHGKALELVIATGGLGQLRAKDCAALKRLRDRGSKVIAAVDLHESKVRALAAQFNDL